jgi:hypothetical protein
MQGARFGFGFGLGLFAFFFLVPLILVATPTLGLLEPNASGWWAVGLLVAGLLLIAGASWRLAAD